MFNRIYEDATGVVDLVVNQNRVFVAVILDLDSFSVSMVKHWMGVLGSVENALRDRQVPAIYCTVHDQKGYRFAEVMGFHLVPENIEGHDVMEKLL